MTACAVLRRGRGVPRKSLTPLSNPPPAQEPHPPLPRKSPGLEVGGKGTTCRAKAPPPLPRKRPLPRPLPRKPAQAPPYASAVEREFAQSAMWFPDVLSFTAFPAPD